MSRRRWLAAAVLLFASFLARAPLLTLLAKPLTVEEEAGAADFVLIFLGDRRFDVAAELYRAGTAKRVLLFEMQPNWLEERGIVSPRDDHFRQELEERGVTAQHIEHIPGRAINSWHAARNLSRFIREHSSSTLIFLMPELRGREIRHIFTQSLGDDADRILWHPLEARTYGASSWWRSKYGVLAVFNAYVSLSYGWLAGPEPAVWHPWDAEAWLRQRAAQGLQLGAREQRPRLAPEATLP